MGEVSPHLTNYWPQHNDFGEMVGWGGDDDDNGRQVARVERSQLGVVTVEGWQTQAMLDHRCRGVH